MVTQASFSDHNLTTVSGSENHPTQSVTLQEELKTGNAIELGYEVGQVCNRNGCCGVISDTHEPDGGCSCHINPPCGFCTTPREKCPVCEWCLVDDETSFNGFKVGPVKSNGAWTHWRPRPLDPSKIDYRIRSHTNSSQICEGVYPETGDELADRKAVEARVKGTFGGRFNRFGKGSFEYVAYTD